MLRPLFNLMEPNPDELEISAMQGYLCLCLTQRQANQLLRKIFKLQLLQGWKIPPCPSGALLAGHSGRVSSLFRLQSAVSASTVTMMLD